MPRSIAAKRAAPLFPPRSQRAKSRREMSSAARRRGRLWRAGNRDPRRDETARSYRRRSATLSPCRRGSHVRSVSTRRSFLSRHAGISRREFPGEARGEWRAEKRKSYSSCLAARWRLSARHNGVYGGGPRFGLIIALKQRSGSASKNAHQQRSGSAKIKPVSQLLAGPHSGPGRSPGAARAPGCEPDPRAPRLVPPHDAS